MPNHVLQKDPAGPLTDADILYLIQGSGLDCDRKVTLALLRAFIVTAADIINTANIVNGAVTGEKLATDSVTGDKIAAGAVGNSELASESVTGDKIAAGAVGTSELANLSVTTAKLANGDVTHEKLAPGAVGTMAIATGAVTSAKLADEAVTSAKLDDEAIQITTVANGSSRTPMFERIGGLLQLKHFIIQSWHIANYAIKSANLGSNSVTEEKLSTDLQTWKSNTTDSLSAVSQALSTQGDEIDALEQTISNVAASTHEILKLSLSKPQGLSPELGMGPARIFGAMPPADAMLDDHVFPVLFGGHTNAINFGMAFTNSAQEFSARITVYAQTTAFPASPGTQQVIHSNSFTVPVSTSNTSQVWTLAFAPGATIPANRFVYARLEFMSTASTQFTIKSGYVSVDLLRLPE